MWTTFLKLFPHITSIIWGKILHSNPKKINNNNTQFKQFTLNAVVLECVFSFIFYYFPKHSHGILGVKELIHDLLFFQ
jgi:hypothetical protein